MKAILNGICVILVALCLCAVLLPKARAGTISDLKEILDGKMIVYDETTKKQERLWRKGTEV